MPPARGDAEEVIGGGIDVVDADLGFFAGSDTRLCHGYSPQYALPTDTTLRDSRAKPLLGEGKRGGPAHDLQPERSLGEQTGATRDIQKDACAPILR